MVKRSKWFLSVLMTFAALIGIASFATATVKADSTESGSAVVTFTHPTLNPSNPRLPLADTSGESANNGGSVTAPKAVVVDTAPEKTKISTTSASATSSSNRRSLADTNGRTTLPQTGTESLPVLLVLMTVVAGLAMCWQVFNGGRKLAK